MQYGSGPVRGFAVTLIIGLLASMFTSIVVTRVIVDWFTRNDNARLSV
jgi:preprotein translocase subunit SecD